MGNGIVKLLWMSSYALRGMRVGPKRPFRQAMHLQLATEGLEVLAHVRTSSIVDVDDNGAWCRRRPRPRHHVGVLLAGAACQLGTLGLLRFVSSWPDNLFSNIRNNLNTCTQTDQHAPLPA